MPVGLFNHSPMLLNVFAKRKRGRIPFKYFKMWSLAPDFHSKIKECWDTRVLGSQMFSLVQRLKKVKRVLKIINQDGFSEIHVADAKVYAHMVECQKLVHQDLSVTTIDNALKAVGDYIARV